MKDKHLLGIIFAAGLLGRDATVKGIASRADSEVDDVDRAVGELARRGLVRRKRARVSLTVKGKKSIRVVFIGGGFEIIHPGHFYTIDQARKLGDVLVVVVARDGTIRKRKGREPIASEEERVKLLSSLRQVDAAILGVEGDIYQTLEKVRPDIVALGYDQYHAESEIVREGARRGMRLRVVRLDTPHPRVKTSALLREL